MRPIPTNHKKVIDTDPYFRQCAREAIFRDHTCRGRITIEHAIIYAGRQVAELWAYVPLCAYAHSVDEFQDCGILDKRKNEYLAFIKATPEDLAKYKDNGWGQKIKYLKKLYENDIEELRPPPF